MAIVTLETRGIAAFLAVSTSGSFTRAALDTGLSEAVLSRLVRALEGELSAPLLERRGANGVQPTEFGELFAAEAPRLTSAHRRFSELAGRLRAGVVGTITIGWPAHGLGALGDELLRALRRRLPDVDLRTTHPELDAQLRPLTERHCDLLVVRAWTPDPDFSSIGPVAEEPRVLGVSANSALPEGDIDLVGERGLRIVPAGRPARAADGDHWGGFPRDDQGPLLTQLEPASTVTELFRRVGADEGVCIVPAALASAVRPDDIRFVASDEIGPSTASLVWRRGSTDAALRAAIDVIVETAAGLPELGGLDAVRRPARP